MGYAAMGDRSGAVLQNIKTTGPTATLTAGTFVFALGPWFPKAFPDLMASRIRTPLGHVHYFGTPPGSDRFTFPNLPSFNFPGVTGWPALPPDNRGFRVRLRGSSPTDPDTSDRAFDRSQDTLARTFLAERFPLMASAPLLETRACHYEMSASGNFIVDRYPGFSNVWVAGGGSAEGFKFGPVMGEVHRQTCAGDRGRPGARRGLSLALGLHSQIRRLLDCSIVAGLKSVECAIQSCGNLPSTIFILPTIEQSPNLPICQWCVRRTRVFR